MNQNSAVAPYPGNAKGYAAQNGTGRYGLKPGIVPKVFGEVGFALHTRDKYDNSHNICGVRKIELFVDNALFSVLHIDEVDFSTTRYVNALMDYELYKDSRMHYHRLYKLPNNKLQMYSPKATSGRLTVNPGERKTIRFVVTDANSNSSTLEMTVGGATEAEKAKWPIPSPTGTLFKYDQENHIDEAGFRMSVPAGQLYQDAHITYHRITCKRRHSGALAQGPRPPHPTSGTRAYLNQSGQGTT